MLTFSSSFFIINLVLNDKMRTARFNSNASERRSMTFGDIQTPTGLYIQIHRRFTPAFTAIHPTISSPPNDRQASSKAFDFRIYTNHY
jgi:hypothetical protein